jgi:hypothetical protein
LNLDYLRVHFGINISPDILSSFGKVKKDNNSFKTGYLERVIALFHLREYFIQKIVG